ncbi:hypothetical protein NC651_031517 [Populus alba x Populus x berolinensis]|nr:hypothetical protein NC651_031517 [Populus alba x Populus x berolinensis]
MCSRGSKLASREESAISLEFSVLSIIPANSMEAPSELVVGQAVQTSAAETKKAKRLWVSDKKYCHGKKLEVNGAQKMEDTQKQFKKLKANYAKLVKSEASSSVILDRLKNDLEKAREAKRLQEQKVEQQKLMINTLQQLLPFEMTEGETGLPVHHPPVYQPGTWEQ